MPRNVHDRNRSPFATPDASRTGRAGYKYVNRALAPWGPGNGGIMGANSDIPNCGLTLYQAVRTDPGSSRASGKAPGLNKAYGNVGNDETMVRDRT